MTFSSRRRGLNPAIFQVSRLARTTGSSISEIGREVRGRGQRISNDLLRALVRLERGASITPRQRGTIGNISLQITLSGDLNRLGVNLQKSFAETLDKTRYKITYEVRGTVGFRWTRSKSVDENNTYETVRQDVNIRGSQIEAFNQAIPQLLQATLPALADRGARSLGINDNYGEVIIIGIPTIEIISVTSL